MFVILWLASGKSFYLNLIITFYTAVFCRHSNLDYTTYCNQQWHRKESGRSELRMNVPDLPDSIKKISILEQYAKRCTWTSHGMVPSEDHSSI